MTSPSAIQGSYRYQNQPTRSRSEKTVARTVFDAAVDREFHELMKETKQMANQIKEPADLWDLEHHLTQRRKEIDRKYDYRYPQLTHVFGRLLYEGRVGEGDLRGLTRGQAEVDPFLRRIPKGGRRLTWILSATA